MLRLFVRVYVAGCLHKSITCFDMFFVCAFDQKTRYLPIRVADSKVSLNCSVSGNISRLPETSSWIVVFRKHFLAKFAKFFTNNHRVLAENYFGF